MFIRKHKESKEIVCECEIDVFQEGIDSEYIIEETDESIVLHNNKKYKKSEVPTPTEEEIQKEYIKFIQHYLDEIAYSYGYTGPDEKLEGSCLSVCSYMDTGINKFDDEGKSFRIWRSAVWNKALEILSLVKSGKMEIPSKAELIEILPKLEVIYTNN